VRALIYPAFQKERETYSKQQTIKQFYFASITFFVLGSRTFLKIIP